MLPPERTDRIHIAFDDYRLEVCPESSLSGFVLRERDVFQSYTA